MRFIRVFLLKLSRTWQHLNVTIVLLVRHALDAARLSSHAEHVSKAKITFTSKSKVLSWISKFPLPSKLLYQESRGMGFSRRRDVPANAL
jgi:hypothetical protein